MDSEVLGGGYSSKRMAAVFSDGEYVRALLDVEVALARAEARLGVIPREAAEEIAAAAAEPIAMDALRRGVEETGHVLVPLVRELSSRCRGEGSKYVHWGATTQDVIDTARSLQLKEAWQIVVERLHKLQQRLAELAFAEAETVEVARTHGQHALPSTFGFKVAGWYWEFNRDRERWVAARDRVLVGNITGAVGTFASFAGSGVAVQHVAMEILGLCVADAPWHSSRDRSAEVGALAAITAGTCQRIAGEIYRLQTTEYGELAEGFTLGKIGSSTMPHKRNPVMCESIITAAQCVRGETAILLSAMPQEHERQSALWKTEWFALPNALVLLDSALEKLLAVLSGLEIDRQRMAENISLSRGLIFSEPVMLALGRAIGREKAHEIIYQASMKAFESRMDLREILSETPEVAAAFGPGELDALFDARGYVGEAVELARLPAGHVGGISAPFGGG